MSFDDSIDDCCCEPEADDSSGSEPVSYAADEDTGYDDYGDTAVGSDFTDEPVVYDDDTVEAPVPTAVAPTEPTISATFGPGVEETPVVEHPTATIGGDTAPGYVIEPALPAATTAFVGGNADPGFTIIPADQPAAVGYDPVGVVGGSWTPGFEATVGGDTTAVNIDAANASLLANFAQQSGLDQPVPAAPRAMDANELLINNVLMQGMQQQLHEAQRGLQDTMSPLYHAGDDIDPDSLFYNDRP